MGKVNITVVLLAFVAGLAGGMVSNKLLAPATAIAKGKTFHAEEITARSIRVVDGDRRTRILLRTHRKQGAPEILLFGEDKALKASIAADENGSMAYFYKDKNDKRAVGIGMSRYENPQLVVYDQDHVASITPRNMTIHDIQKAELIWHAP